MLHATSNAAERRICRAMRAVEVRLPMEGQDEEIQAIIPQEVFEHELGAGDVPACWLEAFDQHRSMLEELIRRKHAARSGDLVVLRSRDLRKRP